MGRRISITAPPLYPRSKTSWYPLNRRLGVPHSPSGCFGAHKILFILPGIEGSFGRAACSFVTVLTELSQFLPLNKTHLYHKTIKLLCSNFSLCIDKMIHAISDSNFVCLFKDKYHSMEGFIHSCSVSLGPRLPRR
jgi:hypothetical protein